ncbi:MAG: PIN domain-containing protein [Candidatus Omnitrophica bacterium]|nr:PIN domain-containing protein [Candidatus Omnitrophota bacterium]
MSIASSYLLDSVILIDYLNFVPEATKWILSLNKEEAVISPVTRAEVLAGIKINKERFTSFLDQFECVDIDATDGNRAAELRQQYRWKLPDALQAACALNRNLKLATRNTKEFQEKTHPFVLIPYSL